MAPFRTTLRARLTLLYVSLLSIVLVLYAASTSIFLWQGLLREMDLSLDRDLETVENLIALTPDGSIAVNTGDQVAERAKLLVIAADVSPVESVAKK